MAEEILRGILDRWKAGVDAHQPQQVAALFTEDAIFQGLRPYSVGRQGVSDYYESQPRGMTVAYRVLETRQPADDVVLGFVDAAFSFDDGSTVDVDLGVLIKSTPDGWFIDHYQVSRLA